MPKSLYKEEHVDRSPDEPPIHIGDSLYNTAQVVKDYPHEVGIWTLYTKTCSLEETSVNLENNYITLLMARHCKSPSFH